MRAGSTRLATVARHPAAHVVAVLLGLTVLVHGRNLLGLGIGQFDFISGYTAEAFAWWADGGLLDPPQWMPYLWGGYPALSNFQNGAYVLPVGLAHLLGGYTLHAAAAVSAFQCAFGALGVSLLLRALRAGHLAALLGLVAWFFVGGFTVGAPTLDIARGYALLPWILLVLSHRFPWGRWFAIPAAALVFWQAAVGVYPGMLVALAYLLPVWAAVQLALRRDRGRMLLGLAVSAVLAVALSLVKFVPALGVRGATDPPLPDASEFTVSLLGTPFFAVAGTSQLPLVQLASAFLPVAVFALLALVRLRGLEAAALVALVALAAALGIPGTPWHDLVTELPGMSLSRFRMSDFRAPFLLALLLLVLAFPDRRLLPVRRRPWLPFDGVRLGYLGALVGVAAVAGFRYDFPRESVLPQLGLLAVAAVGVALVILPRGAAPRIPGPSPRIAAGVLAVLVLLSGLVGAWTERGWWSVDREPTELAYLGVTVDAAREDRVDVGAELLRRPALAVPEGEPVNADQLGNRWTASFYSGEPALFGYVNLRGTEIFMTERTSVFGPDFGPDAFAFWSAPGLAIEVAPGSEPAAAAVAACAVDARSCGADLLLAEPVSYRAEGHAEFRIDSPAGAPLALNLPGYRGWTATWCTEAGCAPLDVGAGDWGELRLEVPAGAGELRLDYVMPEFAAANAVFWGALSVLGLLTLAGAGRGLLRRRARRDAPATAATSR